MSQPLCTSRASLLPPLRLKATLALALALAVCTGTARAATIAVETSATYAPLLEEIGQAYRAEHPDVTIAVKETGSLEASNAVAAKTADIAFVDSKPVASTLFSRQIFGIPLVVVVNPQAAIGNLSRAQIAGVFNGGYTSWKQLGGADVPVHAFTRPANGAIASAFAQTFGSAPKGGEVLVSSAEAIEIVRTTPGAAGFVTLAAARDANASFASIDGHALSDGIGPQLYPFYAAGWVVTAGPPSTDLSRFLAYAETRRALLAKYGIVSSRDLR